MICMRCDSHMISENTNLQKSLVCILQNKSHVRKTVSSGFIPKNDSCIHFSRRLKLSQ